MMTSDDDDDKGGAADDVAAKDPQIGSVFCREIKQCLMMMTSDEHDDFS
jgi:hypothetical protein